MSEDFWDTLKLATVVLKPSLVTLSYCDGMKGGTVALLYKLLLKLDEYYSKPIKGLDEAMRKKMHNIFMSRWSDFQAPIHSAAFATDKQFCRREMDDGIKKDLWSVMEDFSEGSWGQGFQQDEGSVRHVCGCCDLEAGVCQYYLHDITLRTTLSNSTDNIACTASF